MKKILTGVALLITSMSVFAQSTTFVDTTICHEWVMINETDTALTELVTTEVQITTEDANGNKIRQVKQIWDSTSWQDYEQWIITYDANGNREHELIQRKNGSAWENIVQSSYTYDANGNQTSSVHEKWDSINWVGESKNVYTYDANDKLEIHLNQNWYSNAWNNYSLTTYTYDSSGNQIIWLIQRWDSAVWVNDYLQSFTYDANGNETTHFDQRWSGTTWTGAGFRRHYTYDANGNRITTVIERWRLTNYVNSIKEDYTYDSLGNQTSRLSYIWDSSTWRNHTLENYTYDSSGNLTYLQHYIWNDPNWQIAYEEIYTYDNNGNKTRFEHWGGSVTIGAIQRYCDYLREQVTDSCSAYYYLYPDTIPHRYYAVNMASGTSPLSYSWAWGDGNIDTIPFPSHIYDTAGFYTICLTIIDAMGCTDTYCNSYSLMKTSNAIVEVNVISQLTTGFPERLNNQSVVIFPNPATDYLIVEFPNQTSRTDFKVFNILGQLELTSITAGQRTNLDLSGLTNGIYVLEVRTDKGTSRQKFIKE